EQHVLALAEEAGNDAGDVAAVLESGARDLAHEAEAAAAIDQPDARGGEDAAERAGGLGEGGVQSRAGAAIDADVLNKGGRGIFHDLMWHRARVGVKEPECLASVTTIRRAGMVYADASGATL